MTKAHPIELFMPPNMLKAKVGGSIAGLDMSAIKRAEAAMDTLKTEFQDWVSADIEKLIAARDAFAASPSADAREKLYRISHDITGQAQTFEFPMLARVAKCLCHMITAIPDAAKLPKPLIDAHVHAIRIIFRDKIKTDDNPMALELVKELEARVAEIAKAT
jgi:hypothetical protein